MKNNFNKMILGQFKTQNNGSLKDSEAIIKYLLELLFESYMDAYGLQYIEEIIAHNNKKKIQ